MARIEGGGDDERNSDDRPGPEGTVVEVSDPAAEVAELRKLLEKAKATAETPLTTIAARAGDPDSLQAESAAEFFTDFPTANEIALDARSGLAANQSETPQIQQELHLVVQGQAIEEKTAILEKLNHETAPTPEDLPPENMLAREALLASPDRLNDLAWCINKLAEVLRLYHQAPQAADDDFAEHPKTPTQIEPTRPQSKLQKRLRALYVAQLNKLAESSFAIIRKLAESRLAKIKSAQTRSDSTRVGEYGLPNTQPIEITAREAEQTTNAPTLEPAVRRAHSALLLKYMIADGAVAQDLRLITLSDLVPYLPDRVHVGDAAVAMQQIEARLAGYSAAWSAVLEAADPEPFVTPDLENALVAEHVRAIGIITQNLEQVLPRYLLNTDLIDGTAKIAYRKAVLGHDGKADKNREARELWERTLMVLTALCFFRAISDKFSNYSIEQLQQRIIAAYKALVETKEQHVEFKADPLQSLHGVELFFTQDLSSFARYMDNLATHSLEHPLIPEHFKRMIPLWERAGQDTKSTYGTLLTSMMHIISGNMEQTTHMTLQERLEVALSYSGLNSRLQAVLRPLLIEQAKKTLDSRLTDTQLRAELAGIAGNNLDRLIENLHTANEHSQLFGIYLSGIGRTVPEIITAIAVARHNIEVEAHIYSLASNREQTSYNSLADACDTLVEEAIQYMWAHSSAELNPSEMPANAPFDVVFIQKMINKALKEFANSVKSQAEQKSAHTRD